MFGKPLAEGILLLAITVVVLSIPFWRYLVAYVRFKRSDWIKRPKVVAMYLFFGRGESAGEITFGQGALEILKNLLLNAVIVLAMVYLFEGLGGNIQKEP